MPVRKEVNLKKRQIQSVDRQREVKANASVVCYERTLNHGKLGKFQQSTIYTKRKGNFCGSIIINNAAGDIRAQVNFGLRKTKKYGKEIELTSLLVNPERRQEGFFEQILAEASSIGKKRGADAITLEVKKHKKIAREVYRRMGFVEVKEERKQASGPPRVRMRLAL